MASFKKPERTQFPTRDSFERHLILGLMYPASLGAMLYNTVPMIFDFPLWLTLPGRFFYSIFILIYFIGDFY